MKNRICLNICLLVVVIFIDWVRATDEEPPYGNQPYSRRMRRVAPPTVTEAISKNEFNALSPDNLEDLRENVNVYVAPPPYVPPPTGPGGGTSPGDTSSVQLTINASPASQLFISPGSTGEVILNVRNNGAYSVFQFRAVSVTQPQALIQVETVEAAIEKDREIPVRLRLTLPVSVYPGQTLVISFIAGKRYTNDYTSQSIMIQTREKPDDRTPPIVRVLTVGTCNAVPETGNCATGSWPFALEVRDDEIGIRSLVTSPIIPFGREEFVIGSNSSNIRVFRPSCCISRVEVRAEDINGNSNFVIVDRFQPLDVQLGSGDVAAIILGVILLILLVIIVVMIVLQRRKKSNMRAILKRSRDLTSAGEGLMTNKGQER